jgi:hypothetical protein
MASRTKAALAESEADRDLHGHLADVRRGLDRALDVCRRVSRDRKASTSTKGAAKAQERVLRKMLGEVNSLGYLNPGKGSDPDLAPENTKVPAARAAREKAREDARAAKRAGKRADQRLLTQLGWKQ